MDLKATFQRAVELVFTNWTALQLAVEHGMGGHRSLSAAIQFTEYMTDVFCKKANIEVEEVEDILTDVMDSEFNTVCEDESPIEVSQELWKMFQLFRNNQMEQLNAEIQRLQRPDCKQWLSVRSVNVTVPDQESESETDEDASKTDKSQVSEDQSMDISDPADEWTVVRKGRNKH
jgi:pre-rRNA-processing protein TSR2